MNFTPNELQNIIFRKSLIGFHQNQVYDVVQRVVEDYSGYIRENGKMKEKIEDMNEKIQYYKSIEAALQNSLIVAQQSSEEVVANAKKQAENIVTEANLRALEIVDQANRQVAGTLFEKERLHHELEAFRTRAESLLQAQIRLLGGLNADEPEREPVWISNRDAARESGRDAARETTRDMIWDASRKTGRESLSVVGK
jgi:cell division initiation protein